MKYLLILLLPLYPLKAQYLWQIYPDTVIKWNYTDGDEFDGSEINKDKWRSNFPWTITVPSQEAVIRENNVKFNKGIASFIVDKDTSLVELLPWQIDTAKFKRLGVKLVDGNKIPVKYSIGLLWMNKTYKYGYFEIKFKSIQGQGIWPAFWLYGASKNNEIDLLELKGEKEKYLHVDIHCPDGCGNYKKNLFGSKQKWGHWLKTDTKLKDSYNVLAGEWSPKYIKYYLNGQLVAYAEHHYDMGMHVIVGNGIAKDHAPFKPGPNRETIFPNSFLVDYVRIYKTDTVPNLFEIQNILSKQSILNRTDSSDFIANKANKKLLNNRDKKLKSERLLTVSVMPLAKGKLSLRIIGVKKDDNIYITFKTIRGNQIQSIEVKKNTEKIIRLEEPTTNFQIIVNGKEIQEKINFQ